MSLISGGPDLPKCDMVPVFDDGRIRVSNLLGLCSIKHGIRWRVLEFVCLDDFALLWISGNLSTVLVQGAYIGLFYESRG